MKGQRNVLEEGGVIFLSSFTLLGETCNINARCFAIVNKVNVK